MSSMVLDGASPRARATDPVTSVDAGRSVDLEGSQAYVFDTITIFGPFADHELADFHKDDLTGRRVYGVFSPQRLRSARAELVEAGLIEETGDTVLTPYGRHAKVWRARPE